MCQMQQEAQTQLSRSNRWHTSDGLVQLQHQIQPKNCVCRLVLDGYRL